ncbi:unnamed protein product [Gulo gulo]|uniref:Tubulin epsilon and delta complex protein 1 domain-containing protein n=1 Tax=Gulo gulo TaxID=48420 RepID=A0A9X9LI68_GULGU|nr:unnamed protein product [Gulo gulo]
MGKLRFRWRDLITSQQEQCALLSKIHSYTRGCHSDHSLGHLSVAETELLRDPEGGRQVSGGGAGRNLGQCTQRACALGTGPRSFWSDLRLLREEGFPSRKPGSLPTLGLPPLPTSGVQPPVSELLQRLESENTRLEAALEWRRQELVFWQWMVCPAPLPSLSLDHGSPGWGGQLCSSQTGGDGRPHTYPAPQLVSGPGLP